MYGLYGYVSYITPFLTYVWIDGIIRRPHIFQCFPTYIHPNFLRNFILKMIQTDKGLAELRVASHDSYGGEMERVEEVKKLSKLLMIGWNFKMMVT